MSPFSNLQSAHRSAASWPTDAATWSCNPATHQQIVEREHSANPSAVISDRIEYISYSFINCFH